MPPYRLLMEESVVRAATRDGLLKTTTSATIVAAMTARLVALPSAFTKPQTPVPWSSLPVTTVTTESKAVLMDQKMTALGASQRGERSIGAIARAIGGATTNADAGPSSAATERRIAFDCMIFSFRDPRRRGRRTVLRKVQDVHLVWCVVRSCRGGAVQCNERGVECYY